MPKEGRLEKGTMRVVPPEKPDSGTNPLVVPRRVQRLPKAIEAGTWSLKSWPGEDPAIVAERKALEERPGEPTPVDLFRVIHPGCFQLAHAAGTRLLPGEDAGLIDRAERDRRLRGGA